MCFSTHTPPLPHTQVGEIIEIKRDEFIPADVLFLTAENEEGTCYNETMNLDGKFGIAPWQKDMWPN